MLRRRSSAMLATLFAIVPGLVSAQQPSSVPNPDPGPPDDWRAASTCIGETRPTRALNGASTAGPDMTIAKCIAYCDARDFVLAGLQYSQECFCGPFLTENASLDPIDRCTMPCAGDLSGEKICGGPDALSLYVSTSPRAQRLNPDFKSATLIVPEGWSDVGCWVDDADARIIGAQQYDSANAMTVDACVSFCAGFGMPYAAVSEGSACFCDTSVRFEYGAGTCNSICTGDNMVTCGGRSAGGVLSAHIYHNPTLSPFDPGANNYEYRGCIEDPPAYALTGKWFVSDLMTVEICTAYCAQDGYRYAGLGFSTECRCGNEFDNGAGFDKPSRACTMACAGDHSTICGGRYAASIYEMSYSAEEPTRKRRSLGRGRAVEQKRAKVHKTRAPKTEKRRAEIISRPRSRLCNWAVAS